VRSVDQHGATLHANFVQLALRCASIVRVKAPLLFALVPLLASAVPLETKALPKVLSDWKPWVLHDEKDLGCPFLQGSAQAECSWPGRLSLEFTSNQGGAFTQVFQVYREGYQPLPGEKEHWPQNVQVDGKAAVVLISNGGAPQVLLGLGEHRVSGRFEWRGLPESIQIPLATGLLELRVNQKPVAPNRDAEGRVFLQREANAEAENDRIDIEVSRLLVDEIPFELDTRLHLKISGQSREVMLGRALPDGFVPMAIESPLPLKIESDGSLRIQIRPGDYTLSLKARHDTSVESLKRPAPDGLWTDDDEIWVFAARPSLRQVLVEGVPAVDPSTTTLPTEWKALPSFSVGLADEVKLTQRQRGDSDPAPDVLNLNRTLWLDFDGHGYTVSDKIGGRLHRSWRLDMQPGTELGRVVASGADQQITRMSAQANQGVELRDGLLNLEAESRITGSVAAVSAVSWDADFNSVTSVLQLPPGFRLMWARGADTVENTWLSSWTLFDIFLVLLICVAIGRLYSLSWGALALVTLVLIWKEPESPTVVWLAVLVFEGLHRVLPQHWVKTLLNVLRVATLGILGVLSVMFAVTHIRHGMYPALAQEYRQLGALKSYSEYSLDNAAQYERSAQVSDETNAKFEVPADAVSEQNEVQDIPAPKPTQNKKWDQAQRKRFNVLDYDKNATVQTGPGLPRWDWTPVSIRFSGPVQKDQQISLFLLGPVENFALAIVRVLLLMVLVLLALGVVKNLRPPSVKQSGGLAALLMLLGTLLGAREARAQDHEPGNAPITGEPVVPSSDILQQLKKNLLEKPDCAPQCASSPRLLIEATKQNLNLRIEVLAGAETAVPLPGSAQQWSPETVLLDGKNAAALRRDNEGILWLAVKPGSHQVILQGALPNRDTVQLGLLLRSFRVEAKLEGWALSGLREDGVADDNLQLSRVAKREAAATAALQTGNLPPFVRVERTLKLALNWTVETRVTRLTPVGTAVVLEVPLLAGESVTSSEVRVQNQKALVNLVPQEIEKSWTSTLATAPQLTLTAKALVPWVEVWRLDLSPVWHASFSGIPEVHQQDAAGTRMPEWRPWPAESISISVTRPETVQGQTLTVDESKLQLAPGARATDATFSANFRSSRGGLHPFVLPEEAQLQEVKINGQTQPIRQEGRAVAVPLVPGSQSVELKWRESRGISTSYRTSGFELGTPSVNAEVELKVPNDRWVLLVRGPGVGPAVLFWSFLLVLLVVSLGLSRTKLTPLTSLHWVLLSLGLSQVPVYAIAVVFVWLLALGWRARTPDLEVNTFNLRQMALVGATVVALGVLSAGVYAGLLGRPEMQVMGNGSNAYLLRWFVDRTQVAYPTAWALSAPMWVYRFAMLAWSLWMALSLLKWLKWGWQAFSSGGLWKSARQVAKPSAIVVPPKAPEDRAP
jgi:hypothetical protein